MKILRDIGIAIARFFRAVWVFFEKVFAFMGKLLSWVGTHFEWILLFLMLGLVLWFLKSIFETENNQ